MDALERIAEAVLYEGYVLWPYRRSAHKNQQRWTFGGVYPRGFCETAREGDVWRVQTQCLVVGDQPSVDVELRCLHLVQRQPFGQLPDGSLEAIDELSVGPQRVLAWDEARERRFARGRVRLAAGEERQPVADGAIVRSWEALHGSVSVRLDVVGPHVTRVTATLDNTSPWTGNDRTTAQHHAFLSAHFVLRVRDGDFVSATDPPPELGELSAALEQVGLWPVLVGNEGERHTLLASPIILYDYPQIAPESPELLFDSGEIDQLLLLNTLALTDTEKAEMRATDPRTPAILDRAEGMTAADVGNLHGAIRDFRILRDDAASESSAADWHIPTQDDFAAESARLLGLERPTPTAVFVDGRTIQPGSRVKLRPRQGGDIFDLALSGRVATVESIEQDYEERVHFAVTLDDDPGRDFGALRMPGHRFFFSPDEVEPVL